MQRFTHGLIIADRESVLSFRLLIFVLEVVGFEWLGPYHFDRNEVNQNQLSALNTVCRVLSPNSGWESINQDHFHQHTVMMCG